MNYEKLPKTISAEELLSTPLPPVKWIIPDLLPAGLALFAGPSKAGKSWLTLWLCLQVAQGKPMWGREIEPHTVIYFSLEDTFNRLQNRIFQLIDGGDAPERLILQTECPSIGQGLEEQVESLIHTYCDVGLIVIDTLQKVRVSDGNGGMYANDYKEAGALKKIADKYGICILLIHHLRKQSAADPFDQISGSTGLMGVADTSWVMRSIPHDLDEAAAIDGCGPVKILYKIIAPMLSPSLVACGLFQFMWSCNDYMGPLLYVQTPSKYPMSIFVKLSMDADSGFNWNRILALSLISIIPQLVVFFCAQDAFIDGISAGAVKG